MTVSGVRYAYQTAPWDTPLSFGAQAFIEYNGYIINDRYQSDRIRIFTITGLDDADVTDAREDIPGDHGEVAYDAFYRGRTFVMTGRIEAGSLGSLKRMERDVKAAFAPLVESPMKFRWFDVTDTFDDPQTIQNYTWVQSPFQTGAQPGMVSGGVFRWNAGSTGTFLRTSEKRLWGDVEVTVRLVVGSVGDNTEFYVTPACTSGGNIVFCGLGSSGSTVLTVNVGIGGLGQDSTSISIPPLTQGQSVWLRGKKEGDLITSELWLRPPTTNALPDYSTSLWLGGSDADMFGDQVLTNTGFGCINAVSHNWAIDDFKVRSLYPGDVVFNARKMPNGLSIKDSQDSLNRFNRNIQITMRASQSFADSATQLRSSPFTPSSLVTPTLGFGFPLRFPLSFRTLVSGPTVPANTFVTVFNRGQVWTRPIIYIYGATGPFEIINLQNNLQINWNGNLTDGDYLVFDCKKRTLVNSNGINMMKFFSSSSRIWMQLEPGPNDMYFAGSGYSAKTNMVIFSRHGML